MIHINASPNPDSHSVGRWEMKLLLFPPSFLNSTRTILRQKLVVIEETRAGSKPHPQGSAPYISSSMYKAQKPGSKPLTKNWEHRFSFESSAPSAATLRASSRASNSADMITLGVARPSPEYYPWQSMSMRAANNSHRTGDEHFCSSTVVSCEKGGKAYDLSVALNYGYSGGSPRVLRFVTEDVELTHNPPYEVGNCRIGSTPPRY
ncbi:hypothetical protein F4776DRAFT_180617 [Hypoxylon sp. NC0597]|nr:hypothetical protein F4776DRAFT_180617 [Hypoxylon sp. NC0597]